MELLDLFSNLLPCSIEAIYEMAAVSLSKSLLSASETCGSCLVANCDVEQFLVRSFARVYPRSVHGQPVSLKFSPDTSSFYFTFISLPSEANQTLADIFVPSSVHYRSSGLNINVEPDCIVAERTSPDQVLIKAPSQGLLQKRE
ncbi:unnamed protein product, partial [Protopolystoma xenopodis]